MTSSGMEPDLKFCPGRSAETAHDTPSLDNFCQLMVIGANSMPTGIPNLGCGDKETLFSAKQLTCDTVWLGKQCNSRIALRPGPSPTRQLCSVLQDALLCPARHLQGFCSARASPQSSTKGKVCSLKPQGSWLLRTEVPTPDP